MVKISSAPANDYVLVDEDTYLFRLTDVGEPQTRDNPFYDPDGQDKNKPHRAKSTDIRLIWTIEDPQSDFHGEQVHQYYSLSLGSPDYPSKLRPFIAALTMAPVDDNIEYDFDELIDRKIKATVRHHQKKSGGIRAVLEAPIAIRVRVPRGIVASSGQQSSPPQSVEDLPFDSSDVPF